jgi:hypothetical protein
MKNKIICHQVKILKGQLLTLGVIMESVINSQKYKQNKKIKYKTMKKSFIPKAITIKSMKILKFQ